MTALDGSAIIGHDQNQEYQQMIFVGCDFHSRYQQIACVDTDTGDLIERRLEHENGEAQSVL